MVRVYRPWIGVPRGEPGREYDAIPWGRTMATAAVAFKRIPPDGSGGWTGATEVSTSIWDSFPEVPWVCPSFPWVEVEEEDERILIEKLGDKVDQHG